MWQAFLNEEKLGLSLFKDRINSMTYTKWQPFCKQDFSMISIEKKYGICIKITVNYSDSLKRKTITPVTYTITKYFLLFYKQKVIQGINIMIWK